MKKKPKKKMGRPKNPKGRMIGKTVQFGVVIFMQLKLIEAETGKSFAKIVREGGELVVDKYRKQGIKVDG
jgi:hypothetical protein